MDKKKPVVIRKKGKKTKLSKKDNLKESRNHKTLSGKQTNDKQDNAQRILSKSSTQGKKSKHKRELKPMIIATISAIAIGSVLGIIMLNMLKGFENDLSNDESTVSAIHEDKAIKSNAVSLKKMSAYVLQGGMFTEKVNADEWAKTFEESGFPTIIWERENKYFLLAGIASTKEQAMQFATELQENGFDIFVKEWATKELEIDITTEEHIWLQSFQAQWDEALQSVSIEEGILTEKWDKLIETEQSDTGADTVLNLIESIKSFPKDDTNKYTGIEAQQALLNIWQQYEKLLK